MGLGRRPCLADLEPNGLYQVVKPDATVDRDLEKNSILIAVTDKGQVVYGGRDIGVRLMLPRDGASMDSIHDLWPTAATYQRELREMFGIDFPGSPRVDEDFILEGWVDIPPYRREFDTLKYAEETYLERSGRETHDPAEHMKQKLYPETS